MARLARIKFSDPEEGYYHITSRTVLKSFLLDKGEKEYFLKLLKVLSQVYFVRVVTFAIMSNHFHVIIQMIPAHKISQEDLKRRFELYYNANILKKYHRVFEHHDQAQFRHRLEDVSCFIQDLKQRFSRWYNRQTQGHGHVWAERFKSVLLQGDRALLACMVYVELNSVRAGMVKQPEEYRYCGLSHYLTGGRAAKWLDYGSLQELMKETPLETTQPPGALLRRYLAIIYREGMIERPGKAHISENDGELALSSDFAGSEVLSFRRRIRYFSDGVFLGSRAFCEAKFQEFRSYFQTRKERSGKLIHYPHKHKKGRVSAPPDHLLHLHSIRSFSFH